MADDEGLSMTMDVEAQRTRGTGRAASRWTTLAVVLFVVGAWQVGIWANHWYVAERFYEPGVDTTLLLRSGNEAMVTGLVWFAVALVCALISVALRRRRDRAAPVGGVQH
jgi:hypothetical protein